nr:hypothetical protein [Tanacetum cinerariifolium]
VGNLGLVGNKMHKAFPLSVRKFPLSEGTSHCLKKNATTRRKVMPLPEDCTAVLSKRNCVGNLGLVGNKMHKAFPLSVRKFPLPEGTSHCLKKNATTRRKVMPLPEDCTVVLS